MINELVLPLVMAIARPKNVICEPSVVEKCAFVPVPSLPTLELPPATRVYVKPLYPKYGDGENGGKCGGGVEGGSTGGGGALGG